jgi:transcriptional regulator with XRE-family HTH domain
MNTQARRIPRDTLARRVQIARDEVGLSQRAAALRCGITFGEWQGIEAGAQARGLNVKIDKIAKGLGYDRDWLMWGGPLAPDESIAAEPTEPAEVEDGTAITHRYSGDKRTVPSRAAAA